MRKLIVVPLITVTTLLGASACSNDGGDVVKPSPSATSSPTTPAPETSSPEATPSTPSETSTPTPEETTSPSDEDSSKDAQVASFLKEQVPALAGEEDAVLVDLAKGFCRDFKADPTTATAQNFYEKMVADYKLEPFDTGVVMGASTAAYCDEMTPQLKEAVKAIK